MSPLSTQEMRNEWSEYLCVSKEWAKLTILNRYPCKSITKLTEAWSAFERTMLAKGYGNASIVSSYACRGIDGGNWSMHAYRLAMDVDPALNYRQGKGSKMDWSKCKLTLAQSDAVERIRTNSGAQVFRNGWVFKNPDPMHFQIACTQADIASGIDWTTVDGDGSAPAPPPQEANTLYCSYGDGSISNPNQNVLHWQVKLIALGHDTGGTDGSYGDKTKAAVMAVVAGSDGMQIAGKESGVIDVMLGQLGPMIPGGVDHQHDEYALAVHAHVVKGATV